MKRRDFMASTLAATCLPFAAMASSAVAADGSERQLLELRRWTLENESQQQQVSQFLEQALLPSLKRMGIGPVGVFTETGDAAALALYTVVGLTPAQWLTLADQLAQDTIFVDTARDYLMADKSAPAYKRMETQLMRAFEGFPQIQTPLSGERIFEMRVYESHSELKGKLKVEMFNVHEFEIFKRVGLNGVFFGESLAGGNLPNLTYMVAHENMSAHDRAWKAFSDDPGWHQVKELERYKDTVSHIIKTYLKPTSYSQI